MDSSNAGNENATRPTVLDNVSETQILELQRQFNEGDREAWNNLTQSYGWSQDESEAVWQWFKQQPEG